jgi:hypothetical protein
MASISNSRFELQFIEANTFPITAENEAKPPISAVWEIIHQNQIFPILIDEQGNVYRLVSANDPVQTSKIDNNSYFSSTTQKIIKFSTESFGKISNYKIEIEKLNIFKNSNLDSIDNIIRELRKKQGVVHSFIQDNWGKPEFKDLKLLPQTIKEDYGIKQNRKNTAEADDCIIF